LSIVSFNFDFGPILEPHLPIGDNGLSRRKPGGDDRILSVGNTAGEGAKMSLLSFRERQVAFELPDKIEYVELSGRPDFNDSFISVLQFAELDSLR